MCALAQVEVAGPIPLESVSQEERETQETIVTEIITRLSSRETPIEVTSASLEVLSQFRDILEKVFSEEAVARVYLIHKMAGSTPPKGDLYWDLPGQFSIIAFTERLSRTFDATMKLQGGVRAQTLKTMMIAYIDRITPKEESVEN
jgi:hypothetical protein